MWQAGVVESRYDLDLKAKGDEIQKLSVIETLPQLLTEDAHSCITRVLPKIQQSLPTASTEFHMAASVIFKQVLEQRLVSHTTFAEVFLQSILSSLDSREPVVSHAWLETVLDVIELLPPDIVKREILPIAINEGRLSKTVNSRIMCCRLMGKIATRFDSESIKKDVLPTVQSLCQDVNGDVRACICLQLHLVARNLGDSIAKLLPLIVELASDEESNVRQAAVQTIGLLLPHLKPDTIIDIIVPLIKLTCENAVKSDDNVICVVAQEFGKLAQCTEAYLIPADKTWFIKYFIQLAQMGTPSAKEDGKQEFPFYTGGNVQLSDRCIESRQSCAFNMPAMFLFASSTTEGVNALIPTFRNLTNDSYYMVRRTIACSLHEVIKVLAGKSGTIRNELIKLLKDDNEEVLQGLIPHVSEILESLLQNHLVGVDQSESSTVDLGRALIKCEAQISITNNWRLSASILNQFEILPKCFSSDFIYTYLVPVVTNRVLYSRPLPVRLAAGRTLLIFLRYNAKTQQKNELRNRICNEFACGSSCYVRMIFIRMMIEAMTIFSSYYFKEHFCPVLLSMMEDPVANVRLKVITLAPTIKACLRLPADVKLLNNLETNVRNLKGSEKDRDALAALNAAIRQMDSIEVRVDGQTTSTKLSKYDSEDTKKYEEEKKLDAMSAGGKAGTNVVNFSKKPNMLKIPPGTTIVSSGRSPSLATDSTKPNKGKTQGIAETTKSGVTSKNPLIRQSSLSTAHVTDLSKASTSTSDNLTTPNWSRFTSANAQLTTTATTTLSSSTTTTSTAISQPWEKAVTSSNKLAYSNPEYSNSTAIQKVQCSCYELADKMFHAHSLTSSSHHHLHHHHHPTPTPPPPPPPQQHHHHHSYVHRFGNSNSSNSSSCACLGSSSSSSSSASSSNPSYIKTTNLFHTHDDGVTSGRYTAFSRPSMFSSSSARDDKHDIWQDLMLTRSSFANKYRVAAAEAATDYGSRSTSSTPGSFRSRYEPPYWSFSSMPEIPVTLVDDEFMVDAGIRIPSQLTSSSSSTSSQSSAKIPNLQDIIYRSNKRDHRFPGSSFDRSKTLGTLAKSYSLDYDDSKLASSSQQQQLQNNSHQHQYLNSGRSSYGLQDTLPAPPPPPSSSSAALARTSKPSVTTIGERNNKRYDLRQLQSSSSPNIEKKDSAKELAKLKFKQHSVDIVVPTSSDYNHHGRRMTSNLDVNHNQGGLSKIPVRNAQQQQQQVSGSRTAPVTRTSSPIRVLVDADLFADKLTTTAGYSGGRGRRLMRRFRSSDDDEDAGGGLK